jgi:hypothetical protein
MKREEQRIEVVRKKIAAHRRERGNQSKIPVAVRAEILELLNSYDAKALASRIGMHAATFSKWTKPAPVATFQEVVVRDPGLRVVLRSGAEIDGLAFESLVRLLREGGL